MGAMMGAMNATMSGKPIWKGALLGAASTVVYLWHRLNF